MTPGISPDSTIYSVKCCPLVSAAKYVLVSVILVCAILECEVLDLTSAWSAPPDRSLVKDVDTNGSSARLTVAVRCDLTRQKINPAGVVSAMSFLNPRFGVCFLRAVFAGPVAISSTRTSTGASSLGPSSIWFLGGLYSRPLGALTSESTCCTSILSRISFWR